MLLFNIARLFLGATIIVIIISLTIHHCEQTFTNDNVIEQTN